MNASDDTTASPSSSLTGKWIRRTFQAPIGAPWVSASFARLSGLPSLPSMRTLRPEREGYWSVEEYEVPGQLPLADFLTRSTAPVWVFVSIVQQCLAGLVALHQQGLRHGAISPQTLLVNSAGQVVLSRCGGGDPWESSPAAGRTGVPPLPAHLAVQDLRDLGLTFRTVLGGDALQRITTMRSDIAPLVAEWIDWLADPEPGRAPTGAVQAANIFNEIRTGRPGERPWKYNTELPPQVGDFHSTASSGPAQIRRRDPALIHGSEFEWLPYAITALIVVSLLAGGAWLAARFFHEEDALPKQQEVIAVQVPVMSDVSLLMPDELFGMFALTGGDTEPIADTGGVILQLMEAVAKKGVPPHPPELKGEEKLREAESALLAEGEKLEARPEDSFLSAPDIFPAIGTPSPGRTAGDYYLVWRTQGFVMTDEECRAVQSAILRTARYCGVRVMSWVVLPNHAGVVLRVPPRRVIPDENIERRIAILRGETVSERVMSQISAKLRAGDNEGADQVRRAWTASMGTAAGFYSVFRTVPVVSEKVLAGRPLWREKPLHLMQLKPQTADLLSAAVVLDTAPVKGKLIAAANEWPLSGLAAAMLNYGPALRAVSVLMQKDPQMDLPVPAKEALQAALVGYRRHLGDLPPENAAAETTARLSGGGMPPTVIRSSIPVATKPRLLNQ